MGLLQSFQLALKNIMLSKVRSFLTMLGIIIGVGAVILIVGMGNGMKIYMTDSFKSMGTNLLTANIMGTSSSNTVKDKDMYALDCCRKDRAGQRRQRRQRDKRPGDRRSGKRFD